MTTVVNIPSGRFDPLLAAFEQYSAGHYVEAFLLAQSFRTSTSLYYQSVKQEVNLPQTRTTFILVTYRETNLEQLRECFLSVQSVGTDIPIIIINNGSRNITDAPLFHTSNVVIVNTHTNVFPSEARNIGACIANSEWIYFVDDDATLSSSRNSIMDVQNSPIHAARGAVIPKTKTIASPKHYYLGDIIKSHELNIEGNLLIRRSLFMSAGGFDSLMYAHEGKDLTKRCLCLVQNSHVVYDPRMVISHNPREKNEMEEKKKRNLKSKQYMDVKMKSKLDALKALFVVFCSVNSKGMLSRLENIVESCSDLSIDLLLLSASPHETLNIVKDSKLRFRAIILPFSFRNPKYFDNVGYSFLLTMDVDAHLSASTIRESVAKSLTSGHVCEINNGARVVALDRFGVDHRRVSTQLPEFIEHYQAKAALLDKPSLMKRAYPASCVKEEVIFISFFTTDEYYSKKANELRASLDKLGIRHDIVPFVIPSGMSWPDICRKKVGFYYSLFKKYKNTYRKIVWIDVDCQLHYLPSFILDFDVDFMAFRRGFPHSRHVEKRLTRHWEPCFFVFKSSAECLNLLKHASDLEATSPAIKATDDYFFEEAWRNFGNKITAFEIPGEMSSRGSRIAYLAVEARKHNIFFQFGDSGNVAEFKGKVVQHQKMSEPINTKIEVNINSTNSLDFLIRSARIKKSTLFDPKETFGRGFDENTRELVKSLFNYEFDRESIKLNWWIRPSPGNMGDWLSPYIVHKLTGKSVCYSPAAHAKMISLGSIGRYITNAHTVWGTGISTRDTELSSSARYLAVRGVYTAKALTRSGGVPPKIFGDPGIIMPRLYKSNRKACSDYGLVRHFVHQNCDLTIEDGIRDINILLSSPVDIENFIDQLHECKAIVTTSLHVLILCISYRIPCRLISIAEKDRGVHGDGIKYRDFYEGVGINPKQHVDFGNVITRSAIETVVLDDSIDDRVVNDLTSVLLTDLRSNPELYR